MGRPAQLTAAQQAALGQAVRDGRRGGVAWKVLEHIYGRSRWQLQRYAQRPDAGIHQDAPSRALRLESAVCCASGS